MQVCSMSSGSCPSASSTMISPNFFVGGGGDQERNGQVFFQCGLYLFYLHFYSSCIDRVVFFCLECGIGSVRLSRLCHWSPVLFRKFRERISPRCFLYSDGSVCSRKGVYQSEASGPFSLRRAMCDKVSVMP